MQFTPLDVKERKAWREMLHAPEPTQIVAAGVMFLLSALVIPFSYYEAAAGLYLIYVTVFYYMLTRSIASILSLAAPGALLYGLSAFGPALPHPYLMPAIYAAVLMGAVSGGFLLIHCRDKRCMPMLLLPVVAYVPAAFLMDPFRALTVLIPVVLAVVLAHAVLNCRTQTSVLLTLATVLLLSATVAFLIWYAVIGWPQLNPFRAIADVIEHGLMTFYRNTRATFAEMQQEFPLPEGDMRMLAVALSNLFPGILLAGCAVYAFGIFRSFLRLLTGWGTLSRVPLRLGALTVSPFAAGLFLLSYLMSLFGGTGVFGAICANLSFALQPALLLVGVSALIGREHGGKRSRLSLFLLIGLLFLLFNYPTLALSLAAAVGAVRILIAFFLSLRKGERK